MTKSLGAGGSAALAALLGAAFKQEKENAGVDICDNDVKSDELLKLIGEAAYNYTQQPFKIGDIVTVRDGYNLKSHCVPCIVVDALPVGVYRANSVDYQGGQYGSDDMALVDRDVGNGYPLRNVRVISMRHGVIMPMWFEAFQLEYWTDEHKKRYDEAVERGNDD